MKLFHLMLWALILSELTGCTQSKTNIDMPIGTSRELNIRKYEYNARLSKHTLNPSTNKPIKYEPIQNTTAYNTERLSNNISKRRIALVIGNSNYIDGGTLPNPVNDARAMFQSLQRLNFQVIKYENVRQTDMKKAIDNFGNRLKKFDVGLFFYAGHGLQVQGSNFLVPIDAVIKSENDVEYNCVNAERIFGKMEDANCKTNIIILDACRDNPFERSWSRGIVRKGKGLAFMNAPSGSIIAYATSPGRTASDGISGQNGVYTAALLKYMQTPNITIENMFKMVRADVEKATRGQQIPWESTSLKGNFLFNIQK
ncbi:caspase family protein [uncultured Desulfobacter sp.]|uniref:caspase family protein n=1 Tax=uncultured Desulfobacter sp. TaxID=240139 RepID=UPI002AA78E67|nr:caspase family protein [uncultured Desulfobacter sp.]